MRQVFAVSWASLSVSRELFLPLGFSEDFTASLGDIDFCLRAASLGAIVLVEPVSEARLGSERVFTAWRSQDLSLFLARWNKTSSLYQRYQDGRRDISVVWDGYLNDCTGWASEAISYVTQIERVGGLSL